MANTTQKPDQDNLDPAKNVGQDDFDKIIDRNISPGDEKTMEDRAQSGAANDLAQQEADAANDGSDGDDLQTQEEQGDSTWKNNTSKNDTPSNNSIFRLTKKRSAGFGLIAGIVGIGTIISFFIGPTFGLVNLKEVLLDKFDNRMTSLYEKRNARLMAKKFSKEFTTGCTIKVKCRFKGMTKSEIKKFEKRNSGYKIETGRCVGVGAVSRCSVKSITGFDENGKKKVIEAKNFKSELKKSALFRDAMRKYNNPAVAHWRDVGASKFFNKFKVYRGKLKPATNAQDAAKPENEKQKIRIRETVRNSVSGDNFVAVSPNKTAADDGSSAAEDDVRQQMSDDVNNEVGKIKVSMEDSTKAVPDIPKIEGSTFKNSAQNIGNAGLGAVKGAFLGPVALPEKACAAKRLIATVGYAAKALNMGSLIRYSMLFMVAADQIKAGDADGDTAQSIGDLGSILSSRDPETDASASDSFGYQYAAYGSLIKAKDSNQVDTGQIIKYSLGVGMTGVLLSMTNKINSIIGEGGASTCNFLLNPFVQIGVGVVNILISPFTGFSNLAAGAAIGLGAGLTFALAMQIATPIIARSIAGAIVTGDEYGQDSGNAITSGFGAASSMNSRFRGAFPLSKTKAVAYNQYADQTKNQIAKDSGLGGYLDTENPRSFGGKMALALSPLASNFSITSPGNLLATSVSSITQTNTTLAAAEGTEYEICNDPDYEKMNVAAGPFCDVQYGLDPTTVDTDEGALYDADSVIAYMCGSSVDDETPCAEDKYIDDDGNPKGEYQGWIEECVESDQPLASDGEAETPEECFDPATTSDPVKYTMFRMYTFDTTLDDQYNDRDGSSSAADKNSSTGTLPSGSAQELASQIIDTGNLSGASEYVQQIKDVADGKGDCNVDESVLSSLLALTKDENMKVSISSLNRKCTGVLTESGTSSYHYADGGGHAVDIQAINGTALTGRDPNSVKVINKLAPLLPKGSGFGQSNCSGGKVSLPGGISEFFDACDHLHIQMAYK